MADVRIPISINTNLSGFTTLNRVIDETRQKLATLTELGYEPASGGGVRKIGYKGAGGAGTYGTPPMTGTAAPEAPFRAAVPHVRQYNEALNKVSQSASTLGATLRQVSEATPLPPPTGGRRPLSGRALQLLGANAALPRTAVAGAPPGAPPAPPAPGFGAWTGMMPPSGNWSAWTGLMPPSPPAGPPAAPPGGEGGGDGGPGWPGAAWGALRGGAGRLARFGGGLLGVAAGVSVYQALSQAMQSYETRALGVLHIGSMLDQQYGELNTGVMDLRKNYNVLAQQSVASMMTLARATGSVRGLPHAMGFGRAYGLEPEEAAGLYAQLARMSSTTTPNLAEISMVHRELRGGRFAPLPVARFGEEAGKISDVGGTGFLPLAPEQYLRFAGLMTGFGTRFGANPAQAYAEYAEGLSRPAKGPAFDFLRRQALDERAQRQPILTIGGRPYNIRDNYWDFEEALELAGQSGEIQEDFYRKAVQLGGKNTGLQKMFFQGMFNAEGKATARQQFEELQRRQESGGIAASLLPRFTDADRLKGQREDQERLERQKTLAPEQLAVQQYLAGKEVLSESPMITTMEKFRQNLQEVGTTFTDSMNQGKGAVQSFSDSMDKLNPKTEQLLGFFSAIVALGTGHPIGAALGAGMGLHGVMRQDLKSSQEAFSAGEERAPLNPFGEFDLLRPDNNRIPRKTQ